MTERFDYYAEKKWCRRCRRYVRYLMSLYHSYCMRCGEVVTLFSRHDWKKFRRDLDAIKAQRVSG